MGRHPNAIYRGTGGTRAASGETERAGRGAAFARGGTNAARLAGRRRRFAPAARGPGGGGGGGGGSGRRTPRPRRGFGRRVRHHTAPKARLVRKLARFQDSDQLLRDAVRGRRGGPHLPRRALRRAAGRAASLVHRAADVEVPAPEVDAEARVDHVVEEHSRPSSSSRCCWRNCRSPASWS